MANYVIQNIIECWILFVYIFCSLTAGDGKILKYENVRSVNKIRPYGSKERVYYNY